MKYIGGGHASDQCPCAHMSMWPCDLVSMSPCDLGPAKAALVLDVRW